MDIVITYKGIDCNLTKTLCNIDPLSFEKTGDYICFGHGHGKDCSKYMIRFEDIEYFSTDPVDIQNTMQGHKEIRFWHKDNRITYTD